MDALFSLQSAPQVAKWFSGRLIRNTAQERSSKLKTDFLDKLSADGVNVYHLRHGTNPVEDTGTLLHDLFAFLLEVGPFKPRDAVEHLRPLHASESKASIERLVKQVTEALVHAGVLKKEKHVLCLNPN